MGSSDANALLPEDELAAALAEIETMSADEAAAIPSLDDGPEEADDSIADLSEPDVRPATPSDADASTSEPGTAIDEPATIGDEVSAPISSVDESSPEAQFDTPPPAQSEEASAAGEIGSAVDSSGLLDEEDLAAALAEVERITSKAADRPPPSPAAPDSPNEPGKSKPTENSTAADNTGDGKPEAAAAGDDAFADQPSASTGASALKKPRFKIGEQPEREEKTEDVAEYRPPDQRGDGEITVGAAPPVAPFAKRLYRAFDRGLDTLNRPFGRLETSGRALVGILAAVTLIVSILAMLLMPLILPHRDAIAFLQERTAALNAPPPAPDEADGLSP